MRYLLPILFVFALASCEKPQDDYLAPINDAPEVIEPTAPATTVTETTSTATETTSTATETTSTATATTDTATDTQSETTTETTEEPPVEEPVIDNGYSDAHNYIMTNYIDTVKFGNGGDVIAVAPDAQGFDSGDHGYRLMDHAKGVYSNVDYRGIIDTRGPGTDSEFSLAYANNLESNNTIIHFTATDNAYLGEDLQLSIDNMGDNVLNISSLENSHVVGDYLIEQYGHIYDLKKGDLVPDALAYELQLHGSEDYYIAESGNKLDQTIFVGGLKKQSWDGKYAASVAENQLDLFADNMIYVETTGGSSSMGTGTLAGLAAYYASKGLSPQEIIEDIFELEVEYIEAEFYVGNDKFETRTIPAILIK